MKAISPLQRSALHLLAIGIIGAAIYANTLQGAFQFDDHLNIVDNPLIRDLGNFWPPGWARWFGMFTFALNYRFGGLDPAGYHAVNIAIHILNGWLVYALVRTTRNTPFFREHHAAAPTGGTTLAFACALIFVCHPIQTQAVSYIVQRYTSLAAFFVLLALTCYVLGRLRLTGSDAGRTARGGAAALFTAALAAGLLGMKTKENAAILPAVIILYDLLFLSPRLTPGRVLRWLVPAGLGLAAALRFGLLSMETLRASSDIGRHDYFVTQLRVIVTYLRLLAVPAGQTIDHYYPVYRTFLDPPVMLSALFLAVLFGSGIALCLARRSRQPYARLAGFGILWFFVTLSVESSIIPISDVMMEHRLYLPSIGALLAAAPLAAAALAARPRLQRPAVLLGALLVIGLCCATIVRNRVWRDAASLWGDAAAKHPGNPRAHNMLGIHYQSRQRLPEAIAAFERALATDPGYAEARSNLGNAYVQTGRIDAGQRELLQALRANRFDPIDTGILHLNIGKSYLARGMADEALTHLRSALMGIPDEPALHYSLGQAYALKGDRENSERHLSRARQLQQAR